MTSPEVRLLRCTIMVVGGTEWAIYAAEHKRLPDHSDGEAAGPGGLNHPAFLCRRHLHICGLIHGTARDMGGHIGRQQEHEPEPDQALRRADRIRHPAEA